MRLDLLQPSLVEWMQKARVKGKWGTNPVITADGQIVEPRMLGEGLRPSAVTRDLNWGVKVPKVGNEEEDEAMEGKVICTCRLLDLGAIADLYRRLGMLCVDLNRCHVDCLVRRSYRVSLDHRYLYG
jgi:hypothetical protein